MARAANSKSKNSTRKLPTSQGTSRTASTASAHPLSQLTGEDNMSTDSLATESSCGEKEALARRQGRGKENLVEMRRTGAPTDKLVSSLPRKTQSLGSFPSVGKPLTRPKTMIPRMEYDSKKPVRKLGAPRSAVNDTRTTVGRTGISPQKPAVRANANAVNGNVHSKSPVVDSENNPTGGGFKPPVIVSRSGTFLKDEPTILKKPQADNV